MTRIRLIISTRFCLVLQKNIASDARRRKEKIQPNPDVSYGIRLKDVRCSRTHQWQIEITDRKVDALVCELYGWDVRNRG